MINYALLANALAYYSNPNFSACSFDRVETPWSVKPNAIGITIPTWADWYRHQDGKYFVGSGEQGFLQMILDGELLPGRYCSLSPCFRGDEEDTLHKPYFMKVELIDTESPTEAALEGVIEAAKWFITHSAGIPCEVVETQPELWDSVNIGRTFDIVDSAHRIELGSYGIREHESVGRWVYGTGLAEPRTSIVAAIIA